MIRRQIDLDEETDRILTELAQQYHGDLSETLADLVHTHGSLESIIEQLGRADGGFREGHFAPWGEVKRRTGL